MAKKYSLKVKSRKDDNGTAKAIRREKDVPGILYGNDQDNAGFRAKYSDLEKLYNQVGESILFDLTIDDAAPVKALIKDVQRDRKTDKITHVDFYRINMKEPIELEIPLVMTGEAPAADKGGVLVQSYDTINIRCLPDQIVEQFEVDLSPLAEIGDSLRMSDLELPEGYELLSDPEAVIASITAQQVEEEPPGEEGEEAEEGEEPNKEEGEKTSESEQKQDDSAK